MDKGTVKPTNPSWGVNVTTQQSPIYRGEQEIRMGCKHTNSNPKNVIINTPSRKESTSCDQQSTGQHRELQPVRWDSDPSITESTDPTTEAIYENMDRLFGKEIKRNSGTLQAMTIQESNNKVSQSSETPANKITYVLWKCTYSFPETLCIRKWDNVLSNTLMY